MKVGFFVYNLDDFSGAALQALEVAENNRDIDFYIFNQNYRGAFSYTKPAPNITVFNLGRNRFKRLIQIISIILKNKIRIIHFHGFFPLYLLISLILRRKIIVKTTLPGHDDFDTIRNSFQGFFKILLLRNITLNIALSELLVKINSKYIPPNKILKIPNGVNINNLQSIEKEKASFCFVGVVSERKRTYEAIEYFINNYSNCKNAKLYVVGPFDSRSCSNEINSLYVNRCIRKAEQTDAEIIFTGKISKEETQMIFRKCVALIFFSLREGLPNVLLEAMANNCVPITTSIEGVAYEVIDNELNGFVLSDLNTSIPINTIMKISDSCATVRQIEHNFHIKEVSGRYRDIYNQLCE